jgi:exopolyphosphatase/guanosine-5'-triphosphate,3'-diphosphate pyrophosphatase
MPPPTVGIDLGSNTLRAVKRDCEAGEFVAEYEKIVRTADGLARSGRISEAAVERVLAALAEARERLDFEGAWLRAVTTEALRRAANREEVLARIERESGVRFEPIDGEEEARLTLLAVEKRLERLGRETERFVLVDIGGGSTELIFRRPGETVSRSFPLGIVTLSQEAEGSLERVAELLEAKLEPLRAFVREQRERDGEMGPFVATAGTPTTVAAMKLGMDYASYDPRRINGTSLQRKELFHYLEKLLAMDKAARERAVGVGRDDLIAAGILIFEGIFGVLGAEEWVGRDDGRRVGVALARCER